MVWEKVWLEVACAIRRVGDRVGEGQSTETVVGGNDPYRAHGLVCEGGVRQGMVKVRLLCFRWLSPFLKLV
jgi:hypothetical protein